MNFKDIEIIEEDNHLLFVNKKAGDLVQGDKTGDPCLRNRLMEYIKVTYEKPGNVYLGVPHRLDRPTSGLCVFCKTSKSLSRVQKAFADRKIKKIYWALVDDHPQLPFEGTLEDLLWRDRKRNKSFATRNPRDPGKKAVLHFKQIHSTRGKTLLEIDLVTGRHHQIRVQLAHAGFPIIGDLKYGYSKANQDLSIALHGRALSFIHPTTKKPLHVIADLPDWEGWNNFRKIK